MDKDTKPRTRNFALALDNEIHTKLAQLAEAHRRTLAAEVRWLIDEAAKVIGETEFEKREREREERPAAEQTRRADQKAIWSRCVRGGGDPCSDYGNCSDACEAEAQPLKAKPPTRVVGQGMSNQHVWR